MQKFVFVILTVYLITLPLAASAYDEKLAVKVEHVLRGIKYGEHTDTAMDLTEDPGLVVPYMVKYVTDTSYDVKFCIVRYAASANTREGMDILIALTNDADADLREKALFALYSTYGLERVKQQAGYQLRDNILHYLLNGTRTIEPLLLLSSYNTDPVVLERLRIMRMGKGNLGNTGLPRRVYNGRLCFTVLLSVFSDTEATATLLEKIQHGSTEELLCITDMAGILNNRDLLLKLTDLLDDKREVPESASSGNKFMRVCDLTFEALVLKENLDLGIDIKLRRRTMYPRLYDDDVLQKAKKLLREKYEKPTVANP